MRTQVLTVTNKENKKQKFLVTYTFISALLAPIHPRRGDRNSFFYAMIIVILHCFYTEVHGIHFGLFALL